MVVVEVVRRVVGSEGRGEPVPVGIRSHHQYLGPVELFLAVEPRWAMGKGTASSSAKEEATVGGSSCTAMVLIVSASKVRALKE